MEQTYDYDEFITTYLTSLKRDAIRRMYLNIFNNIDKLNNLSYFKEDEIIELDILELEIREIITKHEEAVGDDILNLIVNKIITYVTKELYKQSITLDKGIKLSDLDKVLEVLVIVLTLDSELLELISDEFDSDENDITMAFINILVEYSDLTLTQGVEVIDNVGYDFKTKILDYIEKRKMMKVDNSDFTYLVKIINLDSDYAKTLIVKDFIKDGYEDISIDFNIDKMYENIVKYKNNTNLIAHEITATLFLSNDTRNSLADSLEKYINFESLGYDNIFTSSLKLIIDKLIEELEMRL